VKKKIKLRIMTVQEMMIPGAGGWNLQNISIFTFRNATDWVQQEAETVAV
jgi:hypothetical protein